MVVQKSWVKRQKNKRKVGSPNQNNKKNLRFAILQILPSHLWQRAKNTVVEDKPNEPSPCVTAGLPKLQLMGCSQKGGGDRKPVSQGTMVGTDSLGDESLPIPAGHGPQCRGRQHNGGEANRVPPPRQPKVQLRRVQRGERGRRRQEERVPSRRRIKVDTAVKYHGMLSDYPNPTCRNSFNIQLPKIRNKISQ